MTLQASLTLARACRQRFFAAYTGIGGKESKYPQSSQKDVTRERWEISTCGNKVFGVG